MQHNNVLPPLPEVIVDLRDCFTWSFPEFLPFCSDLFYYSSLKDFKAIA
jgi:hypothetical protein